MATAQTTQPSTPKSIVNSKYRDKYKNAEKDWLAQYLADNATKTRDVKITVVENDEKVTKTEKRPDGVDTKVLFALADKNGINYDNLKGHEEDHGFTGRARMTIGNGLRRVAKQRHGIFNAGGTFMAAPKDFLTQVGAPEKPTHNQDGSKIVVAKPAAEPSADEAKPAAAKKGGKTK